MGFGVIMTCHCGFVSCNRSPTLVGDVDNRGGCARVGAGGVWESSYLPLNFAVNLKLI